MTGLPEIGTSISKYQLVAKVWDGTFSETWQGKSLQEESVAIQIIKDPKMLAILKEHPLEIPSFSHPSLPALLSIEENPVSFVWEYASGRRLSTYIKSLKNIKGNIALYIIRKLLEILRFLLSQGKIHGSIRPSKILVTPDKRVLLCNLGMGFAESRLLAECFAREENVDRFFSILPYFPEEVLKDQIFDDPKSDIFSAGMILCEMLTGKCTPVPEIPAALNQQGIEPGLCSVILKATADFEERYNHPNEMYEDITKLLKLSDQVEKIYVAPPAAKTVNIGMEAIPADSEEYRVYQADVFSAKQTIDAEVVMAEPVEESMQPDADSKITSQSQKSPFRKTVRLDADAILMFSTIDKKILDPLEKESFWPGILGKYFFATALVFSSLFLLSIFRESKDTFLAWFLYPFHCMAVWDKPLDFLGNVAVWGGLFFFSFVPFFDPKAQIKKNPVLIIFVVLYILGLSALGVWGFFL